MSVDLEILSQRKSLHSLIQELLGTALADEAAGHPDKACRGRRRQEEDRTQLKQDWHRQGSPSRAEIYSHCLSAGAIKADADWLSWHRKNQSKKTNR